MREIPSKMKFHGFLGSLGNSDRNAHDMDRDREKMKQLVQFRGFNYLERQFVIAFSPLLYEHSLIKNLTH